MLRKNIFIGITIAIFGVILDQFSKTSILAMVTAAPEQNIEILPFFNLVEVWNHGISFGMLSNPDSNIPYFLIAATIIITIFMLVWLCKITDIFLSISLGLIIGGAIGNIIDRFHYGAVYDFIDIHIAGYHWPVFNVADSSVFLGVALLFIDSIFRKETT